MAVSLDYEKAFGDLLNIVDLAVMLVDVPNDLPDSSVRKRRIAVSVR